MPNISDIPSASTLQQRLDTLNQAIDALTRGSVVQNLTVSPPPAQEPMAISMAIRVDLDPPISDPAVIADMTAALQAQADGITAQLVEMGYTEDPPEQPEGPAPGPQAR